jgi:anti-sigma regulatory factor (Ser/Thr protein kinase)
MESLTVAAHLDALSAIGAFVMQAAERAGIDKRAAYRLRLAVDEIATNIVVHGRPGERGADATILVEADTDDTTLTVTLEDAGPAFNPLEHATPDDQLEKPMHERPIGGLGVFLAIKGVDEFRYERAGSRNRNIFVVNRGATPAETR